MALEYDPDNKTHLETRERVRAFLQEFEAFPTEFLDGRPLTAAWREELLPRVLGFEFSIPAEHVRNKADGTWDVVFLYDLTEHLDFNIRYNANLEVPLDDRVPTVGLCVYLTGVEDPSSASISLRTLSLALVGSDNSRIAGMPDAFGSIHFPYPKEGMTYKIIMSEV